MRIAGIALLGVALLLLGWRCQRDNLATARGTAATLAWRRCYRYSFLVGVPLAVLAASVWVPTGGTTVATVIGCPFPAIFLDTRGRDFVGLTTLFATLANLYVGFRLPSLLLWSWARRLPPSSAAHTTPIPPESRTPA